MTKFNITSLVGITIHVFGGDVQGDQRLMEYPISEMGLSVRARKALSRLNVKSLFDLCQISEGQLMRCKNCGQTTVNEIKNKLKEYNLELK